MSLKYIIVSFLKNNTNYFTDEYINSHTVNAKINFNNETINKYINEVGDEKIKLRLLNSLNYIKYIYDRITYVTYEEFKLMYINNLQFFINSSFTLVVSDNTVSFTEKSNFYLTLFTLYLYLVHLNILDKDIDYIVNNTPNLNIIGVSDLFYSYIDNYNDTCYIYCDDISYSGSQISCSFMENITISNIKIFFNMYGYTNVAYNRIQTKAGEKNIFVFFSPACKTIETLYDILKNKLISNINVNEKTIINIFTEKELHEMKEFFGYDKLYIIVFYHIFLDLFSNDFIYKINNNNFTELKSFLNVNMFNNIHNIQKPTVDKFFINNFNLTITYMFFKYPDFASTTQQICRLYIPINMNNSNVNIIDDLQLYTKLFVSISNIDSSDQNVDMDLDIRGNSINKLELIEYQIHPIINNNYDYGMKKKKMCFNIVELSFYKTIKYNEDDMLKLSKYIEEKHAELTEKNKNEIHSNKNIYIEYIPDNQLNNKSNNVFKKTTMDNNIDKFSYGNTKPTTIINYYQKYMKYKNKYISGKYQEK